MPPLQGLPLELEELEVLLLEELLELLDVEFEELLDDDEELLEEDEELESSLGSLQVGAVNDPLCAPWNPKLVVAPGAREPFQPILLAISVLPSSSRATFQELLN